LVGLFSPEGVLAQATSGSVQQVTQLSSLSGPTLERAATMLTVSVVETESSTGVALIVSSTGLGQGQGQTQGPAASGSGAEPSEEAERADAGPQAVVSKLPAWERLSIGLERAWERARSTILDLESQQPIAGDVKPSSPPAVNSRLQPPASPPPARPGSDARSRSTSTSQAAPIDAIAPANVSSIPAHEDPSGTVDTALEELAGELVRADRPLRTSWGFGHDLPQGEVSGTARALVAVVLSASGAGTAWGVGARWVPRRRSARQVSVESLLYDNPRS
jgi:hypothetical protein